jgi:uncharacterized protein (UPF0297 family)
MEEFSQSKEYKDSVLAHLKKVSQCGCGGMSGDPKRTVDDLTSKLSNVVVTRLVREWLLTLDEQQLQKISDVTEKLEQASMVEIFDVMKKKGKNNLFQLLGELFCDDQADVEELPDGMVEQVSGSMEEEPMVVEMVKDEGQQTP